MLQTESKITIADNSGARVAKIIGIPGYSHKKSASVGDLITVAIQQALPNSGIKRHEVKKAVVIRTKKEIMRADGSYIRFDDNAAVLLEPEKKTPMGTRVFGPVCRELKDRGYDKIVSLAPEVL